MTRGGRGSFDRVMRGLEYMRVAGVEFNVLTTVHAANEHRGVEIYRFLCDDCGARFMQFIPVIERIDEGEADGGVPWSSWRDRPVYTQDGEFVTARSVSAAGYGRFLIDVFEEWVRRDVAEVYVQMFDTALANWVGEQPGMCVHCETCGLALALEHTGDVYPCDHFDEPRHRLGNISQTPLIELVSSDRQRQFGDDKRDALPSYCRECDFRFGCHGGCPKDRFTRTPDGEPSLNYLCPSFKVLFEHVQEPMRLMSVLLTQNRSPSELVRVYATKDARRVSWTGFRGGSDCGTICPVERRFSGDGTTA